MRSLRGHKTDIVTAVCMSGVKGINWEQLAPPILVSLSSDSVVHAWNVIEVRVHVINIHIILL